MTNFDAWNDFVTVELMPIQRKMEELLHVEAYIANRNIYANSDTIAAIVASPHSRTNGKWMIRFSPSASFDRLANSIAIEKFFDTSEEVVNFLICNLVSIYQSLLEQLSQDYKDLVADICVV